jgi:tRNA (Thr-GGU) A37 N-methylase
LYIEFPDTNIENENVDILDGTPLLDIKPYVPDFDAIDHITIG